MLLIHALFTLLLLLVTVLPLTRLSHWFVRGMDFPRLQFTIFAIVLLLSHFLFLDSQKLSTFILITVTILCLAWQLWWILPYTRLWPKEVKTARHNSPENQLSIITSNVLTPNRNAEALIALVKRHQPDVLVTLESDQWWQDMLDTLSEEMPYAIKCPRDNLYGMHVYSRLPLSDETICYLVEEDVPSMHALLTLRSGDSVRVHFLHPAPPSPTENDKSIQRDAELAIVAKSIADSHQAIIVTGDLNDVAWSDTTRLFRKISGLLDPRVGRGIFNTFHADYFFIRWPLDHLFHSSHFTLQTIQRLPSIGSDHFPLLAKLCYSPSKKNDQEAIQSNNDEHQWAQQLADEQKVRKEDVPQPGESIKTN